MIKCPCNNSETISNFFLFSFLFYCNDYAQDQLFSRTFYSEIHFSHQVFMLVSFVNFTYRYGELSFVAFISMTLYFSLWPRENILWVEVLGPKIPSCLGQKNSYRSFLMIVMMRKVTSVLATTREGGLNAKVGVKMLCKS